MAAQTVSSTGPILAGDASHPRSQATILTPGDLQDVAVRTARVAKRVGVLPKGSLVQDLFRCFESVVELLHVEVDLRWTTVRRHDGLHPLPPVLREVRLQVAEDVLDARQGAQGVRFGCVCVCVWCVCVLCVLRFVRFAFCAFCVLVAF